MVKQIPFSTDTFADNPEPRVPSILLLDVSGSMLGGPISELNAGLQTYKYELCGDNLASKRVEVAVVTFGSCVTTLCDWITADNFMPPTLAAAGDTPMGQAITESLSMLRQRKNTYKANGIMYFRPWIFLITDGEPTDAWHQAAEQVKLAEKNKEVAFFSVGVQGAKMSILKQISSREPLKLHGLRFQDLFRWLSTSQQTLSRSSPGDEVALINPCAPGGWACV